MRTLAFDPSCENTGWAVVDSGRRVASGSFSLKQDRFEGAGMRWVRLRQYVRRLVAEYEPEMCGYERVSFGKGKQAKALYDAWVSQFTELLEELEIPYTSEAPGTIKKYATGSGNASKEAMVLHAQRRFPETVIGSHDEADALFLAALIAEKYEGGEE